MFQYWGNYTGIRIRLCRTDNQITVLFEICRGVTQGLRRISNSIQHLLRVDLQTMRNELENNVAQANGRRINHLRYADDTVLITDNFEDLKRRQSTSDHWFMINTSKLKSMVVSTSNPLSNYEWFVLNINSSSIEQVRSFIYLGSLMWKWPWTRRN